MSSPIVRKEYIEVAEGKQLHYRYVQPPHGVTQQQIPIVYLHKSASSSVSYEKLMLLNASKGYVGYAPDMPGFGNSFDPDEKDVENIASKNTQWFVDTFMAAFYQLKLLGPATALTNSGGSVTNQVHIIGHHSGASLASEIAARFPQCVRSITLIGATVIGAEDRAAMKERFFAPFNEPKPDGSHLLKTWTYLSSMGVGQDLVLHQREALDHIRAWRGRNLIYGAVWAQDSEGLFKTVQCPVLALCARDDVLWSHVENIQKVKVEAKVAEIAGANFSLDLDVEGIVREWDIFQKEA